MSLLKQDSGKSNLDGTGTEIKKLKIIAPLELDSDIIPSDISPKILRFYKRKIMSNTPAHIRVRPAHIRYPLVIIFCYLKKQELIDNLVDHLINLIHKIKICLRHFYGNFFYFMHMITLLILSTWF